MSGTVSVVFVDAGTGDEIARSDMPADRLPETFEVATTLQLGDDAWSVTRAEPAAKAEFTRSGRLVLTLARVESVPAREVRYSLATIYEAIPPSSPAGSGDGAGRDVFVTHEDDWRQIELVGAGHGQEIREELRAIGAIFEHHADTDAEGRVIGFGEIHIRSGPVRPLDHGLPWDALWERLPSPTHTYAGFGHRPGERVDGSFAAVVGPVVLFGLTENGLVTALSLVPMPGSDAPLAPLASGLQQLMATFDLYAVDWIHGRVADAPAAHDWLTATLT